MRKKLFLIPVISILSLIFFTTKTNNPDNIITITYNEKPYKIQPQIIKNKNNEDKFFIYDTLNSKQSIRITHISQDPEKPILIENKKLNNIDKIINNIIDDSKPNKFNGININIYPQDINTKIKDVTNININKNSSYILDLGFFINEQKALDQQKHLTDICPNTKNLYSISTHNTPEQYILYKLQLNLSDYNIAIKTCRNFLKYQESCTISSLAK